MSRRARVLPFGLVAMLCVASVAAVSAATIAIGEYRGFVLGTSLASVMAKTGDSVAQPRTIHSRPALLQELTWNPTAPLRLAEGADPVQRIVFHFVDDQLYKILVEYDRDRTAGLTKADLIAALGLTYGTRGALPPASTRPGYSLDSSVTVARWQQTDATVDLKHYEYGGGFGLAVTSPRLERAALAGTRAALVIDAREAPLKEAALIKQRDAQERETAAKRRSTNKDAFKP
jgi:hypothetical protein